MSPAYNDTERHFLLITSNLIPNCDQQVCITYNLHKCYYSVIFTKQRWRFCINTDIDLVNLGINQVLYLVAFLWYLSIGRLCKVLSDTAPVVKKASCS